jgi:catechol-2,3-dioxygenase
MDGRIQPKRGWARVRRLGSVNWSGGTFEPRLTATELAIQEARLGEWTGIAAITLFVEDLYAANTFYEATFGLPIHFEDPEGSKNTTPA